MIFELPLNYKVVIFISLIVIIVLLTSIGKIILLIKVTLINLIWITYIIISFAKL